MPCDGWELHEAYWTLVDCAAAGVALVFWPTPDGMCAGSHPVTRTLAPVLLSPHAHERAKGYIGLAVAAHAVLSAARREV
jgi:hypothetical protein